MQKNLPNWLLVLHLSLFLILTLGLSLGLGLIMVSPVQAATLGGKPGDIVFADDFSQGLGKWDVARGAVSIWQPVSGTAQGLVPTPSTLSELVPKPEFWDPAWRNYEFEVDMLPVTGVDRNLAWGYQNPANWYEIHLLPSFFELALLRNGVVDWSQQGSFLFASGQWHHLKIRTSGGQLQLWIDNILVYNSTDRGYAENPGTIALKVGTGGTFPTTVKFDNVQVRLVADTRLVDLAVPAVRQDDPAWAALTYDKANNWAGQEATTIKRWGCALTSAVMVLRFHGFDKLASGQALTPENLNTWLLAQKDGYIGSGWVNWVALVRLGRELREKFSTLTQPLPQLAYAYRGWSNWTTGQSILRTEIDQRRPAILELPGHFVVARGYAENGTEWLVRDPASPADTLSQVNKPALSARTFQATIAPELLDLSYWLLVFPKGLRVKVFDSQQNLVKGWWVNQDMPGAEASGLGAINNLTATAFGPADWVAMTLPHPPKGRFTLELSRATGNETEDGAVFPTVANFPAFMPFELQFFRYDTKANVINWRQTGSLGTTFPRWIFETGDEAQGLPPSFQTQFGWLDWRTSLRAVAVGSALPKLVVARLDQIAEMAEVSEEKLLSSTQPVGAQLIETQPINQTALTYQLQLNQRYATWLSKTLDQAIKTWPSLSGSVELTHLRHQLGRWLDTMVSND